MENHIVFFLTNNDESQRVFVQVVGKLHRVLTV